MQKYTNEDGRSMVEMLGVLAVIGVLSIGGIQGYTYAMNKYRANNILNELNIASHQLATALLTKETAELELSLGNPYDLGRMSSAEYAFNYGCGNRLSDEDCGIDETGYWMTISGIPDNICNHMLSTGEYMPYLAERKLNGNIIANGATCAEENNEITFLFNSDGSGKLSEGTGGNGDGNNNENGGNKDDEDDANDICKPNGKWSSVLNKCQCKNGFAGEKCEKSLKEVCLENNGYWEPSNYCSCSNGYGGIDCSIAPENTCNGHGWWSNCGMMCNCDDNWTGIYCEKEIQEDNYCNNGSYYAYHSHCDCKSGYGGKNCNIENPCQHGGRWYNGDSGSSGCSCPSDYYGEYCENEIDKNCNNHGVWSTETYRSYCKCEPGFTGIDCGINIADKCEEHGYLSNNSCICDEGYSGVDCSEIITQNPSENTCMYGNLIRNFCYCEPNWAGKDCSVPESDYCKNGFWGFQAGYCICENGWMGENCDIPFTN